MTDTDNTLKPDDKVAYKPPAGWYPDALHGGALRWWDGQAWTDSYQANTSGVAQQIIVNTPLRRHKTSHGFHLLMSIITLGAWLPVWLLVGIYNSVRSD